MRKLLVLMDTFMEDKSKEYAGAAYTKDDSDLRWDVVDNGTSRFGAKFKWDSMSANIEIRPYSGTYRQWWGAWNFGGGSLLVGHTWSPLYINTAICGQCEAGGSGGQLGNWVGDLRQAQIRLTMGGLTVALVEPGTAAAPLAAGTENDYTLPKLEATYALKLGSISLVPFLGWQSYDEVDLATDQGKSIDGMVYGITARVPVGPGYVNAQVWMSTNDANWGNYYHTGFGGAYYDAASDSVKDEDGMGYTLVGGMMLSDTMKFEVGYGFNSYELDAPGTWEDESSLMYAQLEIKIAKGFTVTPEFGVVDQDTQVRNGVATEEGDMTYYGAVWKIHF
ncbi:MAG: hypothetical protein JRJ45_04470 [Deltaproteobacteria bacterium]|nr:hypothetical protein [Deltaproteobacteria bacterium]